MEPRPWPEDGATETEQALLRAGRADSPRKGADARLLASLQESPPPPLKPAALGRWAKLGMVAVAAGGAALVTQQLARRHGTTPPAQPVTIAVAAEVPAEAPRPIPTEAVATDKLPEPSNAVPVVTGHRAAGRRPNARSSDQPLGEETRALDRARVALDNHRSGEALRLLDEYGRRFPRGRLHPESMILRLAALVQGGSRSAAESLAGQLLNDATYEPYAARIQSLLRQASP